MLSKKDKELIEAATKATHSLKPLRSHGPSAYGSFSRSTLGAAAAGVNSAANFPSAQVNAQSKRTVRKISGATSKKSRK